MLFSDCAKNSLNVTSLLSRKVTALRKLLKLGLRYSLWTIIFLCKLITKPEAFEMAADVYNRGKHFKLFSSSLFQYVTGSGNKVHFDACLTVLGTSKTTYKALYFLQYYVLKFKLSKATFGPRSARLRGRQFRNVSVHPAALSRSEARRVCQNLPWIKLFGNREETSERLTTEAICCYTKLFLC